MSDADETIVTRFLVEGADTIAYAKQLRVEINAAKKDLKKWSMEGKSSFKDIADGMKDTYAASERLKASLSKSLEDPYKEAEENIKRYNKVVTASLQEINQEENALFKATQARQKEKAKLAEEAAKKEAQASKAVVDKRKADLDSQKKQEADYYSFIKAQEDAKKATLKEGFDVQQREIKQQIILQKELGNTINRMSKESGKSFKEVGEDLKKAGIDAKMVDREVKQLEKSTKNAGKSFKLFGQDIGSVGDIAKYVFGSILGISAVQVLRSIINYLKEAAIEGKKFTQSIFKLSVAVRSLQRRGLDVSFQGSLKAIDELRKSFVIFSQKEMVEGLAQVQLLTRNFGFTEEQIGNVAEVSAALATILGKDFNEAAREVALFLSSGYAESMQRAGFSVNRLTVQQEALRMGINKSYLTMTEAERASAAYSLIMRQSSDVIQDSIEYQKMLAGQIDKATKSLEQSKAELGTRVLPVWALLIKTWSRAVDAFKNLVNIYLVGMSAITAAVVGFGLTVAEVFKGNIKDLTTFGERYKELFYELRQESLEGIFGDVFDPLEGQPLGLAEMVDEEATNARQASENLKNAIWEEIQKGNIRIRDAELDLQRDLNDLTADFIEKQTDMWTEYGRRREEIILKSSQALADAYEKYQLDVTQINRQYNNKIEDAQDKFRKKETDAEEKFQEKLRQLRENFLLSLEDAVRARDAYQIARLKRKFSMDKAELERERKLAQDSRKKALEDQKKDLEAQRQERLRTLKEDYDLRAGQIAENRDRELALLWKKWEEEQEDLKLWLERQRDERELQHDQTMTDIEQQANDRINLITDKMEEEVNAVEKGAQDYYDAWIAMFGADGELIKDTAWMDYLDALVEKSEGIGDLRLEPKYGPNLPSGYEPGGGKSDFFTYDVVAGETLSGIAAKFGMTYDKLAEYNNISDPNQIQVGQELKIPSFEKGGMAFARKPTTVQFGEVPEIAAFAPLSQLSSMFGQGGGGGGGEKVELLVMLEPGLKGEIIDSTMDEVSNVFVKVQKSTRRR